jgi:tetratricopeptide (TPR) repeat protein
MTKEKEKKEKNACNPEILADLQSELLQKEKEQIPSVFLSDGAEPKAQASFLLHLGLRLQKKECFIFALNLLQAVEENSSEKWLLEGRIFLEYGALFNEMSLLEEAERKLKKAEALRGEQPGDQIAWQLGKLLTLFGNRSGEEADFKRALHSFNQVRESSLSEKERLTFQLDLAFAKASFASLKGAPEYAKEAICHYQKMMEAIERSSMPDELLHRCLKERAETSCQLYTFTHHENDLEQADQFLQEAILNVPNGADLWLHWGELYLHALGARKDFDFLELALEKLTASKVRKCEPLRMATSLGRALAYLGMFEDEYKFIHKGREKLLEALKQDSKNCTTLYNLGFIFLIEGSYLSDSFFYKKAKLSFEKALALDGRCVEAWYGLFLLYAAWGGLEKNAKRFARCLECIKRCEALRPASPIYFCEHGKAALRLFHLNENAHRLTRQLYLEEAICSFRHSFALEENPEILYHWGTVLDALGTLISNASEYEEALSLLESACQKRPEIENFRIQYGLTLLHLGKLLGRPDQINLALKILSHFLEEEKSEGALLVEFGCAKLLLSEFESSEELKREAEEYLLKAARLGQTHCYYPLACLYSLSGLNEVSLLYLKKAKEVRALPCIEHLKVDPWLERLRESEEFQIFINNC